MSVPKLEAGRGEIFVESEDVLAPFGRHDGKTDGVGVGDRPGRHALEPAAPCFMIAGRRETNRDARARVDTVERSQRRFETGPEQGEPVSLGNDQVRGDQRDPATDRVAEQTVGRGVMLIPPAAQRDPGAAIDEQPCGSRGGVFGTLATARQRMSRSDIG